MTPSDQARCAAYRSLLEEYGKPPAKAEYPRHLDYMLALGYIMECKPDFARYHLIHAGVPKDLVLATDALVT